MKFEYHNKGSLKTVILIPGWGTCSKLLAPLYPSFNQIFCMSQNPDTFVTSLLTFLNQKSISGPLYLAGFSMGGFLALDVIKQLDQLKRLHAYPFKQVDLFSIRPFYPFKEVERVRHALLKNPKEFMRSFFSQECDLSSKTIFNHYLETLNLDNLLLGLNYLSGVSIQASRFLSPLISMSVYHGRRDRIAPLREIKRLFTPESKVCLKIESGGHFFFLSASFHKSHA